MGVSAFYYGWICETCTNPVGAYITGEHGYYGKRKMPVAHEKERVREL